jgi:hypothetical protein
MWIARRQPHDRVQIVIQPSQIGPPRALGQALAPPRQHHGAQQQPLHARGKNRVSRVNGILAVAQLMRQADLPEIGMALLRTIEIRHPDARPMARHHLSDHRGGAAVAYNVDHDLIVLEHPVPVRPPIDAHRGFIGADEPRPTQPGEDGCNCVVEARLGPLQHRIQRAFADAQRKQVQEHLRQAAVADRMGEAQIDRQRDDVGAERRGLLQAHRHRRQSDAAAARAMASVALHPGHHRTHHRQINLVIPPVQHLIGLRQSGMAMGAGGGFRRHRLVGMADQRPATACAAQAALARSGTLGFLWLVRLLALRWRQAGIVRGFARLAEPRFKFGNAPFGRLKTLP